MAQVKPPRAAFLDFPLGRQCGKPQDTDLQIRIMKGALNILTTATVPGEIVDLPHEWGEPFDWETYKRDVEEMLKEGGVEAQEWVLKT